MPRIPRPTSHHPLTAPLWALGIILLIPLVALGGLLAVILGAATILLGALSAVAPVPRRAVASLRLPVAIGDRRSAIGDRRPA